METRALVLALPAQELLYGPTREAVRHYVKERFLARESITLVLGGAPGVRRTGLGGELVEAVLDEQAGNLGPFYADPSRGLRAQLRALLVSRLADTGVPALGLSGADMGLLRVRGDQAELHLDRRRLDWLLESGVVPVITPECLGPAGSVEVDAALVAATLATSRRVATLELVVDTEFVALSGIDSAGLAALVEELPSGVHPRVDSGLRAALRALWQGVQRVRLGSLGALLNGQGVEVTP